MMAKRLSVLQLLCLTTLVCRSVLAQEETSSTTATTINTTTIEGGGQEDGADDAACTWSFKSWRCEPAELCSFQYRGGDLTFSQNCRLKKEVFESPQQIHLAYAGQPTGTGMTISWATFTPVADSAVWIGSSESDLQLRPEVLVVQKSYYQDKNYALYEYHATVTGLTPKTKYSYKVGSASKPTFQSAPAFFTTARAPEQDDTFKMVVYGDNGRDKNARTTLALMNSLADQIEMTYLVGDIAYADNAYLHPSEFIGFFYEEAYNQWFNALSPVMSKVPYMVVVGNHEAECHAPSCLISNYKKDHLGNYTAYNTRFKMPSQESGGVLNMWYSFEHGPIHFTSVSSETDYPGAPTNAYTLTHKNGNFGNQLAWLEQDLKKAHANRDKVPWIFVGMHRPLYSVNECDGQGNPKDTSAAIQQAFEDLMIKYQVDVVVAGHHHWYERHFPVAKSKPVKDGMSADNSVYVNPKAPVHIVTGAGGNEEGYERNKNDATIPWNVLFVENNYGINTVQVNRTVLQWQFLSSDSGKVMDEFTIVKK